MLWKGDFPVSVSGKWKCLCKELVFNEWEQSQGQNYSLLWVWGSVPSQASLWPLWGAVPAHFDMNGNEYRQVLTSPITCEDPPWFSVAQAVQSRLLAALHPPELRNLELRSPVRHSLHLVRVLWWPRAVGADDRLTLGFRGPWVLPLWL